MPAKGKTIQAVLSQTICPPPAHPRHAAGLLYSLPARARAAPHKEAAVVAQLNVVGRPLGRIEGESKVTGQARYAADVVRPGQLWGKLLRSPLPHARILHVDTSAARRLPGVHAVLAGSDLPRVLVGLR